LGFHHSICIQQQGPAVFVTTFLQHFLKIGRYEDLPHCIRLQIHKKHTLKHRSQYAEEPVRILFLRYKPFHMLVQFTPLPLSPLGKIKAPLILLHGSLCLLYNVLNSKIRLPPFQSCGE